MVKFRRTAPPAAERTRRALLRRPELAGEILAATLSGRQFTIRDDRIADLDEPVSAPRR